jgi:hypothetical protein
MSEELRNREFSERWKGSVFGLSYLRVGEDIVVILISRR